MLEDTKGTILYVEDNPDNRSLIRRVLNSEGYSVIEAVNAKQAIEKLEAGNIESDRFDFDGYQYARYGWVYIDRKNQGHSKIYQNPDRGRYCKCNAWRSRKIAGSRM